MIPFILAVAGGFYLGKKLKEKFENGGQVRTLSKGDAVMYDEEVWYISEKNGVDGIVNLKSSASGSDYPFIPFSRINIATDLRDMMGRMVSIGEMFANGGQTKEGGSIKKLWNAVRQRAKQGSPDENASDVAYLHGGKAVTIGEYDGIKPYSAQASLNGEIVTVSFHKDNTQYQFTNSVTEKSEDRKSFEKYKGLIYVYIPLTDKLAESILKVISTPTDKYAKGGVLATYEDELNNMTDEQLAAEVELQMGISAEDVLSDIDERDTYIEELLRNYKQNLKSRGEKYAQGGKLESAVTFGKLEVGKEYYKVKDDPLGIQKIKITKKQSNYSYSYIDDNDREASTSKSQGRYSDNEELEIYINKEDAKRKAIEILEKRMSKYAQGGDIRTIKGNNFSDKIENGRKFKELIQRVFDAQGKEGYPLEFIKATARSPHAIVKDEGKKYWKGYPRKGTVTHFEFMNNPNFISALEYVDRPKIRKF